MTTTLDTGGFAVGSRVVTRRRADGETGEPVTGVIVEDFAEFVDPTSVTRTWAVAYRWAIALADGRLVFRDTSELELDESLDVELELDDSTGDH